MALPHILDMCWCLCSLWQCLQCAFRWLHCLGCAAARTWPQAAAGKEALDARWRRREAEYCARTGADSLPPRWFELRAPDGLQRPYGEGLRYRHACLLCPQMLLLGLCTAQLMEGLAGCEWPSIRCLYYMRACGHHHRMMACADVAASVSLSAGTRAGTGRRAQRASGRV